MFFHIFRVFRLLLFFLFVTKSTGFIYFQAWYTHTPYCLFNVLNLLNLYFLCIFPFLFFFLLPLLSAVFCLTWRRAYCNQCIIWVIVCKLKYSVWGAVSLLLFHSCCPHRTDILILVGLTCKFRYSGFSGFSLQSPDSEWSLCKIELFILLDEPNSELRYTVRHSNMGCCASLLNPGFYKLCSRDKFSTTLAG